MSRRARRNHTPAFKAKMALAAVKGERRCPSWRSCLTSTPIRSRSGRRSFRKGPPRCLVLVAALGAATPTVGVKSLHAKIGELTLENDFLEGRAQQSRRAERKATVGAATSFIALALGD
jgi:transposase